ncbi:hypothetical protein ILUMI_06019 [Ignelater luminosus]|uniref:CHK kinase-like domain-containing protein n=1 Tax=Ignelater luminosus TaxID=2038154 RepID=A0A8K0DB64_IGNLU|nr:hypothetical protein ILUMI_06019 [Ignelater luminosus]
MVDLPQWISNTFQDSLRKYFKDEDVVIIQHTSAPAIPIGDNFTTDIFRTLITYENRRKKDEEKHTISIIVKCCPDNEMLKNYEKQMRFFEQEISVYTEVLPAVKELLGEDVVLSTKCISSIREPRSVIILEDLSTEQFKVHPRQHGLDLEHCLLAIEKLAYFHAGTATIHEKNPPIIKRYDLGIFWDNPHTTRWLAVGFGALAKACSSWPGFEKYSEKLDSLKTKAVEKTLRASRLDSQDFSVLNHGDFWITNFMFNYTSDSKLKDCRIVDFQVVLHSSPAIDLSFFWATSPNVEVKTKCLNIILNHYYKHLTTALNKAQYPTEKMPTFQQFEEDFNKRAFYGLTSSISVLPFVTASKRSDASIANLLNDESKEGFQYHAFNNERYRAYMEHLLPFYESLGVFDC